MAGVKRKVMQVLNSSISRRNFIAAVAAASAAQGELRAALRIPVALELYSLRQDAAKDLPGTLAAIAKMGYEGIELVGGKGGPPKHESLRAQRPGAPQDARRPQPQGL
jgi:hypothetical protein